MLTTVPCDLWGWETPWPVNQGASYKGLVSSFVLAHCLTPGMLETGTYISPHLCCVTEPSASPGRPVIAQKAPRGKYLMWEGG